MGETYLVQAQKLLTQPGLGDYFSYDSQGRLCWRTIPLLELARDPATDGTPLELVDVPVVQERARQLRDLAYQIARDLGYTGQIRLAYATKACPAVEIVAAAAAEMDIEITSTQDLYHLDILRRNGLLPREPLVICNGFKPPLSFNSVATIPPLGYRWLHQHRYPEDRYYAQEIMRWVRAGRQILPNLENLSEVAWFEEHAVADGNPYSPPYNVGLRMAFGLAQRIEDVPGLDGRFGFPWPILLDTARRLAAGNRLRPVALHTMVDGGQGLKGEQWGGATHLAVQQFCELRRAVPSVDTLNLGGGIPPASHGGLVEMLRASIGAVMAVSQAEGEAPPACLIWEPGSYVAAESCHYLFNVAEFRPGGPSGTWAVCDVPGFQSVLPDSWATGYPFTVLAATHALSDATQQVTFWDATCDPDGRLPSAREAARGILFPCRQPGNTDPLLGVIVAMGAYQEALSGARGGHHCALREAAEIVMIRHGGAESPAELLTIAPQSRADLAARWGYHLPELTKALRQKVMPAQA